MRYAKPTAAQFAAWIDSYWHKDDKIPLTSIENLQGEFDKKADREYIDNSLVVTIENAKSYTNEKVAVEAANRQEEMAAAIATEAEARQQGDANTLAAAEQATDSKVAAHNTNEAAHADIRQAVAATFGRYGNIPANANHKRQYNYHDNQEPALGGYAGRRRRVDTARAAALCRRHFRVRDLE